MTAALVETYERPEVSPLDGWHGDMHVHAPAIEGRMRRAPTFDHFPKWRRWGRKKRAIIADCCLCRMDPSETVTHGFLQEWYGWTITHECAEGFGCTVKARRRSSRHLRAGWYE